MAAVRALAKPVFDNVTCALSQARAAAFAVRIATDPDVSLPRPKGTDDAQIDEHLSWLRMHALDWLRSCHDEIEAEYRKVHTAPSLRLVEPGKEGA
jgi:hypothetical protein